jgi:hypothetical protein
VEDRRFDNQTAKAEMINLTWFLFFSLNCFTQSDGGRHRGRLFGLLLLIGLFLLNLPESKNIKLAGIWNRYSASCGIFVCPVKIGGYTLVVDQCDWNVA